MKKKAVWKGKKLNLTKETITAITERQQKVIEGGAGFTVFAGCASMRWETRCPKDCVPL